MASIEDAQKAVEFLHGKSFMGNQLKVTGAEAFDADTPAATEGQVETGPEPGAEQPVSKPAPESADEPAPDDIEPASETDEATEATLAPKASDVERCSGEEEPKEG